jgi:hypothetical protein
MTSADVPSAEAMMCPASEPQRHLSVSLPPQTLPLAGDLELRPGTTGETQDWSKET